MDSQSHLSNFLGWPGNTITMGALLRMTANGQPLPRNGSRLNLPSSGRDGLYRGRPKPGRGRYLPGNGNVPRASPAAPFKAAAPRTIRLCAAGLPPYLGLILTNALVVSNGVIIPVQAQKAAGWAGQFAPDRPKRIWHHRQRPEGQRHTAYHGGQHQPEQSGLAGSLRRLS